MGRNSRIHRRGFSKAHDVQHKSIATQSIRDRVMRSMGLGAMSLAGVAVVLGTGCQSALASTSTATATTVSKTVSSSGQSGSSSASGNSSNVKLTQQDALNVIDKLFPNLAHLQGNSMNVSLQTDPFGSGRQVYQINWNPAPFQNQAGPRLTQSFIFASVDANTGQLIQFQQQVNDWNLTTPISAADAKAKAEAWLKELAPDYASKLVLQPNPNAKSGQVPLSFSFVNEVNGVIVPFDHVQIDLASNGQLSHYQFQWHDVTLPKVPAGLIGTAAAGQDFSQSLHLRLTYQQQFAPFGSGGMNLVYVPSPLIPAPFDSGIPSIDAVTGQALGSDGKPVPSNNGTTKLQVLDPNGPVNWPTTLAQPLTQPQAEQMIRKQFGLSGSEWKASGGGSGSITTPYGQQHQTIDVNFVNSKTNENVSANVDVTNGVIVNYNVNPMFGPQPQGTGTTGSSKSTKTSTSKPVDLGAVSDAFVKQILPNLTGAIARVPTSKNATSTGPNQSVGVNYVFLIHGVPMNGFSVFVNPMTGKVVSYNLNPDISGLMNLPDPSSAITETAAKAAYLKADPLVLQYQLPQTPGSPAQPFPVHYGSTAQLVYAPEPLTYGPGTLDAITGKWITFTPPYNQTLQALPSNATPQEKAIALLESHGIIRTTGNGKSGAGSAMSGGASASSASSSGSSASAGAAAAAVDPTATITRIQFERWLTRAYGMSFGSNVQLGFSDIKSNSPYAPDLLQGVMEGWLQNSGAFKPTDALTRVQAADWLVNWMGWGGVASHSSYFKLPFADTSVVPHSDQGAATIAVDSGMLPLVQGNFDPNATLTVGDAALAMVNAIQTLVATQH